MPPDADERSTEDLLAEERQAITDWYALTHTEFWPRTVEKLAFERITDGLNVCASPDISEEKRRVAMGAVAVWREIVLRRPRSEKAFDDLKSADAAAAHGSSEELVGDALDEQWHQRVNP